MTGEDWNARNRIVYPLTVCHYRYEIERQIHGKTAKYNDIQNYDWQKTLDFFAGKSVSVMVRT